MSRRYRRLEFHLARRLDGLPPSWQLRLARERPVTIDGLTLDPGLQLLLALKRRRFVRLETLSPDAARRLIRREAAAATGRPLPVPSVTDLTVDGAAGPLPARHYTPDKPGGPHPLLLFLHGGGFIVCDLDTHDQVCRLLCRRAGVQVLSVAYRLAPEHPFPAAVSDAWAALCWAAGNAARLGADPARLAVGGDSAGGNLSAVVAQRAAREGGPALALQLLLYPAVDRTTPYRSLELFADGFFLTRAEIDWFDRNYSSPEDRGDPRLSPLRGADLSGLAPALVVTAGFDPLRDEGEAYAAAMAAAGTEVRLRRHSGMIHGFANMIDLSRSARAALVEVADEVGSMLADAKPVPEGPAERSGRKGAADPPVRPAARPRGRRRPVRWPLAGKVVLVTGAARGIGAETARVAAARGARVALAGLEPELLAALAASLGPGHTWDECDVTDQAGLERAVAAVAETMGGIDVVVANAGVANNGTVAANPVSALVRTIEVDLVGVVRTVSATLPHVTRGRGYYLLVSSAAAFTVLPGMAGYCAAKAGVEQFGNALRLELAHKGVAVGTAHTGWVDTDLVRDLRDDLPALRRTLRRLPWPLRGTITPAACAEAFVDGIEHRRRRVYVPRALAGVQATRTVFTGPVADLVLRRGARTLVPELEREVALLGRPFGRHSTALDADRSGEPVR